MNRERLTGIDLNLLVVFDALFTERHVTRAATRLGITQSAMSHALRRLRELFDDPLFARTPRGMIPTERANQLAEPIRRILADIEQTISEREFDARTAERTFTIVASDYTGLVLLPPLLRSLSGSAPGINLSIRAGMQDWNRALEEGRVDLVIGVFDRELPTAYHRELFQERFVCVVRADHPFVGSTLTLDEYVSLPHALISPRGTSAGGYVDDQLAKVDRRRRIVLALPQFLVAPYAVAASNMILTAPERLARQFAAQLPLRTLAPPIEIPGFTVSQYWHGQQHHDPGHIWLRNLILQVSSDV